MTGLNKDAIKAALESRIEDLARHLLPSGHRKGRQWVVGDVKGNSGKSLRIELAGPKQGKWFDQTPYEGGDVFALISANEKISEFPDVLKWAADWLGESPPPPIINGRDRQVEADAEAERKRAFAQAIWKAATS